MAGDCGLHSAYPLFGYAVVAMARVRSTRLRGRKKRLVTMISRAGAAPAITVSSDMERMVAVTRLETFVFVIFNRSFRGCESSPELYQAATNI